MYIVLSDETIKAPSSSTGCNSDECVPESSSVTSGIVWSNKHYQIKDISQYNLHPAEYLIDAINMLQRDGYLTKKKLILDAACGQGRNTLYLLKHGYSVLPVDASIDALELTNKLLIKNGYNKIHSINSELQDMKQINDESVDGIISIAVLTHIFDIDVVLNEFYRILKPEGIIIAEFATIQDSTYNELSENINNNTIRLGKNVFLEEGTNVRYFQRADDVDALFHRFKTIYPTTKISFDEPGHTNSRPYKHTHSSFVIIAQKK